MANTERNARPFYKQNLIKHTREERRIAREVAQIGRARIFVIDERGFLSFNPDGARLLFQVFADTFERQSLVIIIAYLEFSRRRRCSMMARCRRLH